MLVPSVDTQRWYSVVVLGGGTQPTPTLGGGTQCWYSVVVLSGGT